MCVTVCIGLCIPLSSAQYAIITLGGPKTTILKSVTPVYDDVGRHSIYEHVQLFISSKTGILNVAILKCSLHKIREKILRRKYQLI